MSNIKHITPPSYPTREGSHLREILNTLRNSEYIQTFRDPTSPNWEIPHGAGKHWTPERWEDMGTHVLAHMNTFSCIGEQDPEALLQHGESLSHATGDEEQASWWWSLRALQAWEAGDVACRRFVQDLAMLRLDIWSHGDKRRGIARERAARAVGDLRFDAATKDPKTSRCPRALELAREIQVYQTSEAASVNQHGRTNDGDRVAQALMHVGACLAGMCAARRLWDRGAWLDLTRRAIVALGGAWTCQEALLAQLHGHGYGAEQRKATARAMVLLALRNRARRMSFEPETAPDPSRNPQGFAHALADLVNEGWHPVVAFDTLDTAAHHVSDPTVASPVAGLLREQWCQWATAARLRGYEHDGIVGAPAWAFDPGYLEAEAEDMAPEPRPKKVPHPKHPRSKGETR